jgi:hypothetical protein
MHSLLVTKSYTLAALDLLYESNASITQKFGQCSPSVFQGEWSGDKTITLTQLFHSHFCTKASQLRPLHQTKAAFCGQLHVYMGQLTPTGDTNGCLIAAGMAA